LGAAFSLRVRSLFLITLIAFFSDISKNPNILTFLVVLR
jgi:hypothetical protein